MSATTIKFLKSVLQPILATALLLSSVAHTEPTGVALPTGSVQRIAFGSCIQHTKAAPLLRTIVEKAPDIFVMLGDAIYPDLNEDFTEGLRPWPTAQTPTLIKEAFGILATNADWRYLQKNIPLLAVWDDHDYGINDGALNFKYKVESQKIFLDFFSEPANSPRRTRPGMYDAKVFGPAGKSVQIILLDTRYFRTPPRHSSLSKEEREKLNIPGSYIANTDPTATMLGEAQWHWLEEQLKIPADVRLIVSSSPIISREIGRDFWETVPSERSKLFELIRTTSANGVLLLSGDQHFTEISKSDEGPYPLFDFTSSPLAAPSPSKKQFKNSFRITPAVMKKNFGIVDIDWESTPSPLLTLQSIGVRGEELFTRTVQLSQLRVAG